MREAKNPSPLPPLICSDIPLGVMVMLLLSSLDSQKYSPSSSARIPVIVRVRLTPSSWIWKRLLGLISTAFLRHTTLPLAWLTSQLKVTLPPISALTASSCLVIFTGISKMERKEKNCEKVEVMNCVPQNLLEPNLKGKKQHKKDKTNKNPQTDLGIGVGWNKPKIWKSGEILSTWNYMTFIILQHKNNALKRLEVYLPVFLIFYLMRCTVVFCCYCRLVGTVPCCCFNCF